MSKSKSIKLSLLGFLIILPLIGNATQICQTATIPATTPTTRFTDNGNGTVTDKKTGLMWKKCTEGQVGNNCSGNGLLYLSWQTALQQAQKANAIGTIGGGFAGFSDWRVPNIKELDSIVERQCYNPAINLAVFPNTSNDFFWSSSPVNDKNEQIWVISFEDGHNNYQWYGTWFSVRLVRGGQ